MAAGPGVVAAQRSGGLGQRFGGEAAHRAQSGVDRSRRPPGDGVPRRRGPVAGTGSRRVGSDPHTVGQLLRRRHRPGAQHRRSLRALPGERERLLQRVAELRRRHRPDRHARHQPPQPSSANPSATAASAWTTAPSPTWPTSPPSAPPSTSLPEVSPAKGTQPSPASLANSLRSPSSALTTGFARSFDRKGAPQALPPSDPPGSLRSKPEHRPAVGLSRARGWFGRSGGRLVQ